MIASLLVSLFLGLLLIFFGFVVKNDPTLISGYHRLDENQKKTFPDFLKKSLIIIGLVAIVGCGIAFLFKGTVVYRHE
jgi:hypothetical protein